MNDNIIVVMISTLQKHAEAIVWVLGLEYSKFQTIQNMKNLQFCACSL